MLAEACSAEKTNGHRNSSVSAMVRSQGAQIGKSDKCERSNGGVFSSNLSSNSDPDRRVLVGKSSTGRHWDPGYMERTCVKVTQWSRAPFGHTSLMHSREDGVEMSG